MSKFKHTPGPWDYSGFCKIDNCFHVGTIGKKGTTGINFTDETSCKDLVADICTLPDAKLISCAPEMLECLIEIVKESIDVDFGNLENMRKQSPLFDCSVIPIIEKVTGMKIEEILE